MRPRTTEAEIQAEFFHQCRIARVKCRLEFYSRVGRLDVLIVAPNNRGGLLVVECKRSIRELCVNQLAKYRWLKLPVLTLCAKREIPGLIERIKTMMPNLEPIRFAVLDGTEPLD